MHEKIGAREGLENYCLNIWVETSFSERIKEILYHFLNLSLPLFKFLFPTHYTYHHLHHPTFLFPIIMHTVLGSNCVVLALKPKFSWVEDGWVYLSLQESSDIFSQHIWSTRGKTGSNLNSSLSSSLSSHKYSINTFRASMICHKEIGIAAVYIWAIREESILV